MLIRPAEPSDLSEIIALVGELADFEQMADQVAIDRGRFERELFGPEPSASVLLGVTDDGEVAGMALWFRTFSTFLGRSGIWLEDLFVRPRYRRHGLGSALLTDLRARTDGRVEWDVLDWNVSAQALYDGLGARPVPGWVRYRWTVEPST